MNPLWYRSGTNICVSVHSIRSYHLLLCLHTTLCRNPSLLAPLKGHFHWLDITQNLVLILKRSTFAFSCKTRRSSSTSFRTLLLRKTQDPWYSSSPLLDLCVCKLSSWPRPSSSVQYCLNRPSLDFRILMDPRSFGHSLRFVTSLCSYERFQDCC